MRGAGRLLLLAGLGSVFLGGCSSAPPRVQLDYLLARQVVSIPGEGPATPLPSGRYTVFVEQYPADCVSRLTARYGARIVIREFSGLPLMVQRDLVRGDYRFGGESSKPGCSAVVQVVLNSVAPGATPPARPHVDIPLPAPISVRSDGDRSFTIPALGNYMVMAEVRPLGLTMCAHEFRLTGPDPSVHPFITRRETDGTLNPGQEQQADTGGTSVLLGPGTWHVDARTGCPWTVSVRPMTEGGGGESGF